MTPTLPRFGVSGHAGAVQHALPMEKPELVNRLILDFLQNDPVPTFMPQRRASGADHEQ